jgi:uncharacterized protein
MTRCIGAVLGPLIVLVASTAIAGGARAADAADDSPFAQLCRDAQGGDAKAEYVLGCCYNGDHGVQKDPEKAAVWWERAAAQGVADAQYYIGLSYYAGIGVPKDPAVATRWWKKAAEQDHADAEYFLGISYNSGVGVPRSTKLAVYWLQKSASRGNSEAVEVLRRIGPSPG